MSESRIHLEGLKPGDVALLRDVAEAAASAAVEKTFIAMGLDPKDPIRAQADLAFLRQTRERCDGAWGKALMTIIGLFVAGAVAAAWTGFKAAVGK